MEIIKSKRKSKCYLCYKKINQKYKIREREVVDYHLSCYFTYLKRRLEDTKQIIKQFSKQKYKRQMILENLEK